MFSVQIPNLAGTDSVQARKLIMQFMREVNLKVRVMEENYDRKIKELEKEIKRNG